MIKMDKKTDKYLTFFLVVIIILLANAIISRFTPTIDLTEGKIYSISKESKLTVKNLVEPMTVKVFYTPDMPPPYSSYVKYIKDILQEYKRAGKGNFKFEIIDSKMNPNAPNEYDISPIQIEAIEKDDIQVKRAHLGIAMIYGATIEKIPFVQTVEGLEYELTSMMKKMADKSDRLARLENNIDVYLFLSSNIPLNGGNELPKIVEEKVKDLNKDLMNKLTYRYVDSVNHSDAKELAEKLNVPLVPWDDIKNQKGDIVVQKGEGYIGLVLSSGTNTRFMDVLSYSGNVANMISEGVDSILDLTKVVGYTSGHGEPLVFNPPQQFAMNPNDTMANYADRINENYMLWALDIKNKEIQKNVNAMIMVNPSGDFTDYEIYQIDQFIMKGQPVVILKSSFDILDSEEVRNAQVPPTITASTNKIDALLNHYGIEIIPEIVLDKKAYKTQFNPQTQAPPQDLYFIPFIENTISQTHTITKKINALFFPFSSAINYKGGSNARFTPIVKSSKESWTKKDGEALMTQSLYPPAQSEMSEYVFAGTLEGKLTSYFKDKEIPAPAESENKTVNAKFDLPKAIDFVDETDRAKIVIISSSEMAKNSFFAPNEVFLMNAIDWSVGNINMMSVRRKGLTYNPPRYSSDFVRLAVRIANIVMLPAIVVAFGLMLYRRDIKRRKKIKEIFSPENGDK